MAYSGGGAYSAQAQKFLWQQAVIQSYLGITDSVKLLATTTLTRPRASLLLGIRNQVRVLECLLYPYVRLSKNYLIEKKEIFKDLEQVTPSIRNNKLSRAFTDDVSEDVLLAEDLFLDALFRWLDLLTLKLSALEVLVPIKAQFDVGTGKPRADDSGEESAVIMSELKDEEVVTSESV